MPDSTVHKTNIFGQEYIMKSSADAALMSKISKYVNQKMDELEESGLNPNSEQTCTGYGNLLLKFNQHVKALTYIKKGTGFISFTQKDFKII